MFVCYICSNNDNGNPSFSFFLSFFSLCLCTSHTNIISLTLFALSFSLNFFFNSLLLSRTNNRFSNAYAIRFYFCSQMTEWQSFIKLFCFSIHPQIAKYQQNAHNRIWFIHCFLEKSSFHFQFHSNTFNPFSPTIQTDCEYFTYSRLLSHDINNLFARILLPYLLPTPFR